MLSKMFRGENYKIVGVPFVENDKQYIIVHNIKTDTKRQVRWYTFEEYSKAHPEEKLDRKEFDPYYRSRKDVFGFKNGYIFIFKGDTEKYKDWMVAHKATKTYYWGWNIASTEPVPTDVPDELTMVKLNWEDVALEDDLLKSDKEIIDAVNKLLYPPSKSNYLGEVGEEIEAEVSVISNLELSSMYGSTNFHIMEDKNGNILCWNTKSKKWKEYSTHKIKGTIKRLQEYKGTKQTILTRCVEVA